jgi:hypothetical protein
MANSYDRAKYETRLASAHRALFYATAQAEQMGDDGAAEDLRQIAREIQRLAEASLKGKVKPQMKGQLRIGA